MKENNKLIFAKIVAQLIHRIIDIFCFNIIIVFPQLFISFQAFLLWDHFLQQNKSIAIFIICDSERLILSQLRANNICPVVAIIAIIRAI